MKRKVLLTLLVGIFLVTLVGLPAVHAAKAKDSIKIGFILELTGFGSFYGLQAKDAIEVRLEEANYQVAGKRIEVVWEDSKTDPGTASQKVKKLVELDKVDLLFGTCFSDAQDVMAPYLAKKKILNIAPVGGDWTLRQYGNWVVFPGTPDCANIPLGDYAYEQGWRTMVTLGNDYSAGYGHIGGPVNRFKELGGTVVQQLWVPYGTVDYGPYIASLKKADVFVHWTCMPDTMYLLRQYYEFGAKTPMLLCEAEGMQEHLAEVGKSVVGLKGMIRVYSKTLDYPANHKFVQAIKAKTGKPPEEMHGCAYASISAYLAGLEATGGDARLEVLRPAIIGLKLEDTPCGPVSFTSNGYAITNRHLVEAALENGEYVWKVIKVYGNVRDPRDK